MARVADDHLDLGGVDHPRFSLLAFLERGIRGLLYKYFDRCPVVSVSVGSQ